MRNQSVVEQIVRRDQWIAGVCLFFVAGFSWLWLLAQFVAMRSMADMGMTMPVLGLNRQFGDAAVMWGLMMTAMMLPSAAPMVLTYARFERMEISRDRTLTPTATFAAVYVAIWIVFSLVAAGLQVLLVRNGTLQAGGLAIGSARISGALLILLGLYQLTPFKRTCLTACRSPLPLFLRQWRPGLLGTLRLGAIHGLYCVGCCWLMMALLFVFGVMNMPWVGLLATIVLVEKVVPFGERIGAGLGFLAVAVGVYALGADGIPGLS